MFRKMFAVLGISLLCLAPVALAQDASTHEEIDKLKEEIKDLEIVVMKI